MPRDLPSLRQVVDAGLCSGCGGCSVVAPTKIRIELGVRGHLEPTGVELLDREEDLACVGVCPGAIVEGFEPTPAIATSPLWGPVASSHVAWATDPTVRHDSSSGGALSALAAWMISSGRADSVLHVRASDFDPARSDAVLSTTVESVLAGSGSRYQPVAPLERLLDAVETGGRCVLVGRPCDISAARRLAKRDPDVDRAIVLYLSIFCAGTPGMTGTTALLGAMAANTEDVAEFRFRGHGWPGQASARMADESTRSLSYAESWGRILNRHLPWRCKLCPDGTGELADISFGDAWHLDEAGQPSFDEHDGRSAVLARTDQATELLDEAVSEGALAAEGLLIEELQRMQPYQAARKQEVVARLAAWRVVGRRAPRYSNLGLRIAARHLRPTQAMRAFAGTVRRVIRSRPEGEV